MTPAKEFKRQKKLTKNIDKSENQQNKQIYVKTYLDVQDSTMG